MLFLLLHLSGFGVGGPDDEVLPDLGVPLLLLHPLVTCQTQRMLTNVKDTSEKKEVVDDNLYILAVKHKDINIEFKNIPNDTHTIVVSSMAKLMTKDSNPNLNDKSSGKNVEDHIKENFCGNNTSVTSHTVPVTAGQSRDANASYDVNKPSGGENLKHTPTLVDILLEYQGLPIHFSLLTFLLCLS